jgi:hypothetical protein
MVPTQPRRARRTPHTTARRRVRIMPTRYDRAMDEQPFIPRPADFKTTVDGTGGLILVTLVGDPHDGRELYIDELDLPPEIWTTGAGRPFEWWPPQVQAAMAATPTGSDAEAPPVRYVLRVPDDTGAPLYVADSEAR